MPNILASRIRLYYAYSNNAFFTESALASPTKTLLISRAKWKAVPGPWDVIRLPVGKG